MTIDEKRLAEIRRDIGGYEPGDARMAASDLLAMLDASRGRAEDAERKLATLVAADVECDAAYHAFNSTHLDGSPEADAVVPRMTAATEGRSRAIADAASVAERHDREVWVKELRRLADGLGRAQLDAADLRDEADRIERGEA